MLEQLNISQETKKQIEDAEKELTKIYEEIEEINHYNSAKVLTSFIHNNLSEYHLAGTTGYGYGDAGRDRIEQIYTEIFKSEDSLVRSQFISGTHAITTALFACLRPKDILLSITGKPYDTLDEVIGLVENPSSLKSFQVQYEQIDLIDNDFDYAKIKEVITNKKIKVIEIQRSKGYSKRKSIDIEKLEKVIQWIKKLDKDIIVIVDNCYCEFVSKKEPSEVGADLTIGSLIKNLGAGIAPNGAYITGRKDLIKLCAERLNVPGEAKEVGPSLDMNKFILQGLYFAPSVVSSALKTAILTSYVLEQLGYEVEPKYNEKRTDIVQNIIFHDKEKLIQYCKSIQATSPIDASVTPIPWDMPGYTDQVIMAAGTFIQGSSIELSCDGPIRPPYIAYQQGGLMYSYGRISVMKVIESLKKIQ